MDGLTKKIVVSVPNQCAELIENGLVVEKYAVSTSMYGTGCEANSNKTPLGKMRIAEKLGEGAPLGTVFKDRKVTGEVWSRNADRAATNGMEDLILTRILWLEGIDPENANTKQRCIYFHGTNVEGGIGLPMSHGCIRMKNTDIVDLFSRVDVGTVVEIRD